MAAERSVQPGAAPILEEDVHLLERVNANFFGRSLFLLLLHNSRRANFHSLRAKKGDRALDLCCGSGDLTFLLSQKVGLQGEVRLLVASFELHFPCHLELYLHFTILTRSFGCIKLRCTGKQVG